MADMSHGDGDGVGVATGRGGVVDRVASEALRLQVSAGEWDAAGDVTPEIMLLVGSERTLGPGTDIGPEAAPGDLEAVWTELFGAVAAAAAQLAHPEEARREVGYGLVNVIYAQVARIERRIGEAVARSHEIAERLEHEGAGARRAELEGQAEDAAEQLDALSRRRAAIDGWAAVAAQQYRELVGESWIDRQPARASMAGSGRRESWESLTVLSSRGAPWHQVVGALEAARADHGEEMTLVVDALEPPDVIRAVRHWATTHGVELLGEGADRALPASWEGDVLAARPRLAVLMGAAGQGELAARVRAAGTRILDVSDAEALEEAGRRYREDTREADRASARSVVVADAISEWGRRAEPAGAGLVAVPGRDADGAAERPAAPGRGGAREWRDVRRRMARAMSALGSLVPEGSGLEDMTEQLRWGLVNSVVMQAAASASRLEDLAAAIEAEDETRLDGLLVSRGGARSYVGVLDETGIAEVRERLPGHFPPPGVARQEGAVPVLVTCRGDMPVGAGELGDALDKIHAQRPGMALVVTDSNHDRLARQAVGWAEQREVPWVWAKTDWSAGAGNRRAMFSRNAGILELGVGGVLEFRTLGWERGVPAEGRRPQATSECDGPTMNLVDRLCEPGPHQVRMAVIRAEASVYRFEGELDRAGRRRLETGLPGCFGPNPAESGAMLVASAPGAAPDRDAVRASLDSEWERWGEALAAAGTAVRRVVVVDGADPVAGVVDEWARERGVAGVIAGRLGQEPDDGGDGRARQIAGLGLAGAIQFRAAGQGAGAGAPDNPCVRAIGATAPVMHLEVPAGETEDLRNSAVVHERAASRLRTDQVARAGRAWEAARVQAGTYAVLAETARAVYGDVTGEVWRMGSRQVAEPLASVMRPPPAVLDPRAPSGAGEGDPVQEWEQAVAGLGEVDGNARPELREALVDHTTSLYQKLLVSRHGARLQDHPMLKAFHRMRGVGEATESQAVKVR